jgi:predicted  nucleic acid-binding Zn-ribbon protein
VIIILVLRRKREYFLSKYNRKKNAINNLQEEIIELEDTSKGLMEELQTVKNLEQDIKEKIKNIEG